AFITQHQITSFVLFARNIPDLESAQRLIARIHTLAEHPLIAVDQEGGRVTRLPTPATHMPSAMALGATGSPDLAFRAGQTTARELRAMGLNAALAPVLDVNNNPANPVIGTRSFGMSPDLVAQMGVAWLRGAQGAGIAACAKHFPGHGDTHVDSHADLPRITKSRGELERVELAPFRAAIAAGVELLMPGHLLMTALDDARPASLSRHIVTDLLRGEMRFAGTVITDALDMDAVARDFGIPNATAEAAIAGCDLVVPIAQHAETLRALQRAVDDGRLPLEQVSASAQRTQRLREKLAALPPADPSWLGAAEHQAVAQEIARRAIRVHDARGMLPLRDLAGFAVIDFALGKATIAEGASYGADKLLTAMRATHPALDGIALPFGPDERATRDALAFAANARGLIIAMRQALHFASQQAFVRDCLALDKPTVLIAMRDPYDLDLFPDAPCAIATFDDSPAMISEVMTRLKISSAITPDNGFSVEGHGTLSF
ncbi:MAG: glycoside hydrolase family 3 protein, partial [Chloroflexota bacterium]